MTKEHILVAALADKDISTTVRKHILQLPSTAFTLSETRKIYNHIKEGKDPLDLSAEELNKIVDTRQSSEYKVFFGADKELQISTVRNLLNEYKEMMITKYLEEFNLKVLKDRTHIDALVSKVMKQIGSLPSLDSSNTSEDAVAKVLEMAKEAMEKGDKPVFETGYRKLNKAISGGFRQGDVAVLLGPSGQGKTTFVQNLVRDFNYKGYKILYITTEMQDHDLAKKFMKMEAYHENVPKFNDDVFDLPNDEQYKQLVFLSSIVNKYNVDYVFADDTNRIAFEINRKDYNIVIVDHLHDIKNIDDMEVTAELLNTLKNWAINSDGLCIALTQPRKKGVNQYYNKDDDAPRLSVDDIKGSHAIQAKASQILILHRDDKSVFTEVEVAKNRWGGTKGQTVLFGYDPLLVYKEK